ncbi:transposase [Brevibacterium casei]|uniref:transposase n=1 Tax=Brevibacterium casei TaxID=33889 RepID=UPI0021AF5C26|nr:transposase [Brevibacterium casei]MCT2184765.1 transposase [Brevibacterium casei]
MPKIYTNEFKQSALNLINDGLTQKQVYADLGVSKSALQSWVRDARLREHGLEPSHDPDQSRAQAAALKRIRKLERENKILREAAEYLSQANRKLGGTHPQ